MKCDVVYYNCRRARLQEIPPIGSERTQRIQEDETGRHLAKEAEINLCKEIAQKLYIQGQQLAARHHAEIESLAAHQLAEMQKLSTEAQETVKKMFKAQTAASQGASPKTGNTVMASAQPSTSSDQQGTIFKTLDQ